MKKILIIEDDEKLRSELEIFLNNNGYQALSMNDFKHAIDDILSIKPDLLLLDINLPGIDGEFICKEIRKKSNMPIIIITSKDSEIDEIEVDNYVNSILKFSLYFEEHKNGTIVYMKKLWFDIFNDRISFIIGFQLLISLYYDILKYK